MIHAGLPPRIYISGLPALSGVLTEGSTPSLSSDYYSALTGVRLKTTKNTNNDHNEENY